MTLGADLVVLAIDERRGTLNQTRELAFALAGAEIVDLARVRRIEAAPDARVKVTESLATGDVVLDATLAMLTSADGELRMEDAVTKRLPGSVARHVAASLDSGELAGRAVTTRLGGEPMYHGLRVADPARRRESTERLADAVDPEADLALQAFGALVHIAGPGLPIPGKAPRRARRRLATLADRFGDTWRYLPGCPPEFALDADDLERGQVHPLREAPWRLAIRLAVQEAGRRVPSLSVRAQGGAGLDRDVANAALLDWAFGNGA
jgi:hypothetical protein